MVKSSVVTSTDSRACRGVEMPKLDGYLTMRAAAEYLGVCQNTVRNREAAGKIPIRRHPLNNYRFFATADL